MTWNEFKLEVEKKLAEKNATGNVDIWFIDVSFPEPSRLSVEVAPGMGLNVC